MTLIISTRWLIEYLINWKEAVITFARSDWCKPRQVSLRIFGVGTEFPAGNFPNISLVRKGYINFLVATIFRVENMVRSSETLALLYHNIRPSHRRRQQYLHTYKLVSYVGAFTDGASMRLITPFLLLVVLDARCPHWFLSPCMQTVILIPSIRPQLNPSRSYFIIFLFSQ
jgi:hypothetical protein